MLHGLEELSAARDHHTRALAIFEAQLGLGPTHLYVANTLSNLGSVLADLGELRAARAALERVLAILEAELGPDHPNTATGLDNLGNLLHDLGELSAAATTISAPSPSTKPSSARTTPPPRTASTTSGPSSTVSGSCPHHP